MEHASTTYAQVTNAHLEVLDHVDGDVQRDGDERRVQDDEGEEAEEADQDLGGRVEQAPIVGALARRTQTQVPVILRTERRLQGVEGYSEHLKSTCGMS